MAEKLCSRVHAKVLSNEVARRRPPLSLSLFVSPSLRLSTMLQSVVQIMNLEPGDKVGRYEILSFIGAGGMGQVYRARDAQLAREVAVKLLPAAVAGRSDLVARFHQEARALG